MTEAVPQLVYAETALSRMVAASGVMADSSQLKKTMYGPC
jgi:hypothetical protein